MTEFPRMEKFHKLLLGVWREACRHIEITESAATVAGMLQETIPLQCLLVRRLNMPHSSLETIAWGAIGHFTPPAAESVITPARFQRLLQWAKAGKVEHSEGARR